MADYFNDNPVIYRFWSKAAVTANTQKCWLWQAAKNKYRKNYGVFTFDYQGQKTWKAHRLAFLLYFGVHPRKLHVLHKCDEPQCVNPHHLFLGTNLDNITDKIEKRRHLFGENIPAAILTNDDVIEIKMQLNSGVKVGVLANYYGVNHQVISDINCGRTWKSISPMHAG